MTTATANATAFYPAPDLAAAVARGLAAAVARGLAAAVARGLVAVRDRPNPGFDADCSPQKYAGMAQNFRASAWEHLDKGDLAQASNKAWGLVAETVKAISTHHGGFIHSHHAVGEVVRELARLVGNAGDMETRRWLNGIFMIASRLHSNFYENEMPENQVLDGLILCEQLSEKLYELFYPAGHSP